MSKFYTLQMFLKVLLAAMQLVILSIVCHKHCHKQNKPNSCNYRKLSQVTEVAKGITSCAAASNPGSQ